LKSVALNDGQLAIQLEPPAAVPALFVFISGLSHVEQVRLADQPLPQVADMDTLIWQEPNLTSGWTPHTKGVFIRLMKPSASCTLQVSFGAFSSQ
jgi:hypothetical protein